jgi:TP901 family phage tail tape measure protein
MARLRGEKLSLDIVIGGNQAQKELGDLEKEAREVKKQLEELGREIDKAKGKDKDALKEMIAQRRDLKAEIQDVRNQIKATDRTDTETLKALRARRDELIQKERELGVEINSTKAIDKATLDQMQAERSELLQKQDAIIQQEQAKRKELGLHGLTYKQLGQEAKRLSAMLSQMTYGTEEWKKLDKELQQVLDRQKQVKHGAQQTGFSLGKMANGFNKYFLMISSFLLGFTGLVQGVRKAFMAYAEFDDKLADVMKTTGLTKVQVKELNAELEKIDTRSTQEDLLDLARIAGKLGISAKEDVEGFVRAADKINVALSEDLGGNAEEAIRRIGKLVDIFKLKERYGMEDSLLKVGSAINALGAASTANEEYLVEFTNRVAGVAPNANISLQSILGLAATLDQLGQTSEVSSTVFSQLLPDMFKDTATYAGLAGMKVDDFSKLLNTDANEAMIKVLEGLNGNNEGFGAMVNKLDALGLEGKRAISVLGVLANNTDILRQQQAYSNQEFEKGTSILNEFNTKNTTAKAELEKAVKVIQRTWRELGEKLAPAIRGVVSSGTMLARGLTSLVNVFIRWGVVLKPAIVFIVTYTAVFYSFIAATKIGTFVSKGFSVVLTALRTAWAFVTKGATSATVAAQGFNKVMARNIWGAAIAAIATLVSVFMSLRKETERSTDAMSDFTVKSAQEQRELEGLFEVLKSTKEGTIERKNAIDKVNEVYGEYLPQLLSEKTTLQDIQIAQQNATKALIASMGVKAKAASDQEIFNSRTETELGLVSDLYALVEEKKGKNILPMFQQDYQREVSYIMSFGYSVERAGKLADKYGISQNKVVKILNQVREARVKERDELARNQVFFSQYIATMDQMTGKTNSVDTRDLQSLKKEETELRNKIKEAKKELVDIEKNDSWVQTNAAKQRIANLDTELNANIALQEQKKESTKTPGGGKKELTQEEKDAAKKAHEDKMKELQRQAEEIKKAYESLYDEVAFVELTEYDRSIALLEKKFQEQQQIIEKARTTMIKGADGREAPVISAAEATRSLELIEVQYLEKRMEIDRQEFERLVSVTTQKVQKEEEYQLQVEKVRQFYSMKQTELERYELSLLEEQYTQKLISQQEFETRRTEILGRSTQVQTTLEEDLQRQLLALQRKYSGDGWDVLKTQLTQLNEVYEQKKTEALMSEEEYTRRCTEITENKENLTKLQVTAKLDELNTERETRKENALVIEKEYYAERQEIITKAAQDDTELKAEADRLEKMIALRKQYGLQSTAELLDEELADLKEQYKEMGLTDAEYAKARAKIIKEKTKYEAPEQDKLTGLNAMANLNAWFASENAALQQQYAGKIGMEDAYQSSLDELTRVHESTRKEIRDKAIEATLSTTANMFGTIAGFFEEGSKEYKLFSTFQVTLDTIQAGMAAYKATIGIPVVGPVLAPAAAATAAAFGYLQIKKIWDTEIPSYSVTQKFMGNYNVLGEQDGRRYQAKYKGKPKTGYVSTPSLYLAGDDPHRLKEMIISGPDLKHPLIADYARAIMDIKANRMPMVSARSGAVQQPGTPATSFSDANMVALLASINQKLDKLDNPTRAKVVYADLEEAKRKMDLIRNDVRR